MIWRGRADYWQLSLLKTYITNSLRLLYMHTRYFDYLPSLVLSTTPPRSTTTSPPPQFPELYRNFELTQIKRVCSWAFLWAVGSQIMTRRVIINYESFALALAFPNQLLELKLTCFCESVFATWLRYLSSVPYVQLLQCLAGVAHLEFLILPRGSPYSLLPIYWPFSSLLNQAQQHIFTQYKHVLCNKISCQNE